MILVGELALWVALLMAAWGAIVLFAGGRGSRPELVASGERALHAAFASLVLATAGLVVALVTSNFSFDYVASFTSANLPVVYKVAALWAGQPGSLLLYTLTLSTCAASVVAASAERDRMRLAYAAGTLATVLLFLLILLCLEANPFQRLASTPVEGRGMDAELQNPAMVVHAPALYLGYAATAIPFAFTVGALVVRRLDDEWAHAVRRWETIAWVFLTIGMITGMWWAYVEPMRNRDWAWEPIVSFAFFPWLTASAVLVRSLRTPTPRLPRAASVILVAATFCLALAAAFMTQRSIVSAVQAPPSSVVGAWMAAFLCLAVAATGSLVATRRRHLAEPSIEVPVAGAERRGIGRARVARYLVSAGVLLFAVGLAGWSFRKEHDVSLSPGEVVTLIDAFGDEWTFASQGVSDFAQPNRGVEAVAVRSTREGATAGLIRAERRLYVDSRGVPTSEPSTEAGIDHSLVQDTYVVVTGVTGDRAQLRIAFNPLMTWVWIGSLAIALGGVLVAWPVPLPRPAVAA